MRFVWIILTFHFSLLVGQTSINSAKINSSHENDRGNATFNYEGKFFFPFVGYQYNWNGNHFIEAGIGFSKFKGIGFPTTFSNISLSGELRINKWDELLYGPKLSVWFSTGGILGVSFAHYRLGQDKALILRPEIGLGPGNLKWVYGYNIPILDNELLGLARHNIQVIIPFKYEQTEQ